MKRKLFASTITVSKALNYIMHILISLCCRSLAKGRPLPFPIAPVCQHWDRPINATRRNPFSLKDIFTRYRTPDWIFVIITVPCFPGDLFLGRSPLFRITFFSGCVCAQVCVPPCTCGVQSFTLWGWFSPLVCGSWGSDSGCQDYTASAFTLWVNGSQSS